MQREKRLGWARFRGDLMQLDVNVHQYDDHVADQSITRDDEQMTRDDKTEVSAAKVVIEGML